MAEELVEAAAAYDVDMSKIQVDRFVCEADLDLIVGWYNIQFLVMTRLGAMLCPVLKRSLETCRQKPFDPNMSSDEKE